MSKSTITMRALKDFRGQVGEGSGERGRIVEAGDVFEVANAGRRDHLQLRGLAVEEGSQKSKQATQNKALPSAPSDRDAGRQERADKINQETNARREEEQEKKEAEEAKPIAPLSQAGGKTGQDNFASLSEPVRQHRKPTGKRSPRRKAK